MDDCVVNEVTRLKTAYATCGSSRMSLATAMG